MINQEKIILSLNKVRWIMMDDKENGVEGF